MSMLRRCLFRKSNFRIITRQRQSWVHLIRKKRFICEFYLGGLLVITVGEVLCEALTKPIAVAEMCNGQGSQSRCNVD
jgi:hypothetical protein